MTDGNSFSDSPPRRAPSTAHAYLVLARRLIILGAILLLVLLVVAELRTRGTDNIGGTTTANYRAVARVDGRPAPGFEMPGLDGGSVSLADHRGHTVVLNFWATWCAPCRLEAPALESASEDYRGRGVRFIGINYRDDAAAARAYEGEFGITYPSAYDPGGNPRLRLRTDRAPHDLRHRAGRSDRIPLRRLSHRSGTAEGARRRAGGGRRVSVLGPFALALAAGVISFTSPCCLPLMPGYVAYVSGVAGETGGVAVRTRVVGSACLFVLGFAMIFTLLGVGVSIFGASLLTRRPILIKVGGAFVIAMGLVTMGLLKIPFLYRELRLDLRRVRPGPLGAIPLGMAFAIGWSPCIGPVLAGILTAAAGAQGAVRGGALLFVYSLGLGIPFVLLAFGYARAGPVFRWLRRHGRAIEIIGGSILVVMGVLMISGQWLQLFTPLLRWFARAKWPPL